MGYFSKLYKDILIHKQEVIKGFHFLYFIIIIALMISALSSYLQIFRPQIYPIGVAAGQFAVIFFCLSLTPGIAKRFGYSNLFITVLATFRRQLGVSMFAFSFFHYSALRLFPILFGGASIPSKIPTFEIIGVAALYALIPLWLTSNDGSVRSLKRWWHRIHSMVYFIIWLIFAHVALQGISPVTILLGIYAILEVWSLTYIAVKHSI